MSGKTNRPARMTRKHFELIALVIQGEEDTFASTAKHAEFATAMAVALAETNDVFDVERFITACMPAYVVGTSKERTWDRACEQAIHQLSVNEQADNDMARWIAESMDKCPEHGDQAVRSERASGGSDPYSILKLACGHEVMNLGDGNIIV